MERLNSSEHCLSTDHSEILDAGEAHRSVNRMQILAGVLASNPEAMVHNRSAMFCVSRCCSYDVVKCANGSEKNGGAYNIQQSAPARCCSISRTLSMRTYLLSSDVNWDFNLIYEHVLISRPYVVRDVGLDLQMAKVTMQRHETMARALTALGWCSLGMCCWALQGVRTGGVAIVTMP
eukprot:5309287-Pleurochrysis_carterae.AAC.2